MKQTTYLNTILTVLAILLAANLWMGVQTTQGGALFSSASEAHAAGDGIPNAGSQRKAIVDELRKLNGKTDAISNLLTSGKVRVIADIPHDKD